MTTLDLELEIGRNLGDGYPVLARAGKEVATTRLPVTSAELDRQFVALRSAVLAGSTAGSAEDQQHMRELGTQLFEALVAGDVRDLYVATRQRAREQGGTMRLALRVRPAELARLPWEFLFDPASRDYLGLTLSLVRYPEPLVPRQPMPMAVPLRILGMSAHPGDQDQVDAEEQRTQLHAALAGLEREGLVELGWVAGPTSDDLEEALNRGPWHGFYFVGRGEQDWSDDLGRLLADHRTLRLVVLNAHTGSGAVTEGFAGTAGALVRQGIPAIVAMQFEITTPVAMEFAPTLYRSVASCLPVDIGVMRARRAVRLAKKDTLEWGTPVLYLRASDGRIFNPAAAPPVPAEDKPGTADVDSPTGTDSTADTDSPADAGALYDEALDAFWAGQWEQASELLRKVLALRPDHPDAAVKLDQSCREHDLVTRYTEACAAAESGDWEQAIEGFTTVAEADPADLDVQDRLEQAHRERAAAALRAESGQDGSDLTTMPDEPGMPRHPKAELILHTGKEVNALAFSPDGDRLATAGRKNIAQAWDTTTGEELLSVGSKAWRRTMEGVTFSPDGRWLATASDDCTARIWDATSGEELLQVSHELQVWGAVFSPDGRWLATASDDCTARIWDVTSGEELIKIPHDNWVRAVAFSPDGRWLATAGVDRTARIWDATDGEEAVTIAHDSLVTGVTFSPDGGWLATASDDGTARIWDAVIGQEIDGFSHDGPVTSVAFSLDGRWLATGGQDCTARIWDLTSGWEIATVRHATQVWTVAFSPDGAWLATGSADRTARLWSLTTPAP